MDKKIFTQFMLEIFPYLDFDYYMLLVRGGGEILYK